MNDRKKQEGDKTTVAPARDKSVAPTERTGQDANRPKTLPPPEPARTPVPARPAPQNPAPSASYRSNYGGGDRNNGRGGGNYGGGNRNGGRGGGNYGSPSYGRRDQWRHDHFNGSWNFLIYSGPYAYPRPVYIPNVLRVPRYNADVYIEYAGSDATGSGFDGALQNQLSSQGLSLTTASSQAALELYIVSMDEDPTNPGYGSAVSVSYILIPGYRFITAQLLDVGSQQVDDLAASVASYARQLLDEYR
jgi:hypothetical protein